MKNKKRMIDANAIPESATAISTDGKLFVAWSAIVDATAVDAVEVIRCMNCKYYNTEQSECNIKFDSDGEKLLMPPDAYCSDGKRRKKNEHI